MDVFEVRFRGGATANAGINRHPGHLVVTAHEVRLVIRTPLLPEGIVACILFGSLGIWLLALEFDFFTGYTVASFLQQYYLIPGISLFLLCLPPLRQKRLTVAREELTCCEAHVREVILATAEQQMVLTLPTTDGACMLVKALCEDIEQPYSLSIYYGRDLLKDSSGFTYLAPVIISVEQDVLTLRGAIIQAGRTRTIAAIVVLLAGILLPFLVVKMLAVSGPFWQFCYYLFFIIAGIAGAFVLRLRKVSDVRTFPCAALQGVEPVEHYITFLLPDNNRQRRYTLLTASPEEACLLAQRLQQKETKPWQTVCHLNKPDKDDATLMETAPHIFAHPGTVTFSEESVTFHGDSGIPDSRSVRFSFVFSLLAFVLLLPFSWKATNGMQFSLSGHIIIMLALSLFPAILGVYIPVSIFLAHIFASHRVVSRKQVALSTIFGNELTLHIGSPTRYNTISLLARTSSEVQLMKEKLSVTN